MAEFHETIMGKRFFEATMPTIATNLGRIAKVLEAKDQAINEAKAQEFDKVKAFFDMNDYVHVNDTEIMASIVEFCTLHETTVKVEPSNMDGYTYLIRKNI